MYEQETESPQTIKDRIADIFAHLGSFILSSIEIIVTSLTLSLLIWVLIASPHQVVGYSMYPNFHNGDSIIANKIVYKFHEPKRGEVIIFKHTSTEDYIKRIIGLPGETVSIRHGNVYINGKRLDESEYLSPDIYTQGESYLQEGESTVVPPDSYFVMGDNRPHSSDSRDFGPIKRSAIKGRAWLVWLPLNRFHIVKQATYSNWKP